MKVSDPKSILLFATLLLMACPPRSISLNESLFYFNNAYRWKRTDVSSDFVHPQYRQSILKDLRNQERIVDISDLEVEDVFINNESGIALVKIRISYLPAKETILHEEYISQYWVKKDSRWFFAGQTGSNLLSVPVPDELKQILFAGDRDAGLSDN